ncbi:MAG: HAD family hydrolase [bacterium]|nr:HAD family hydrolase [bacterium]
MAERRVLALDFDGVFWNSVRECYEVALEAWEEAGMPPFAQPYERFRDGRWLVRAGRDFGTLMRLLEADPQLDILEYTPEQFAEAGRQHPEWLKRYGECFGRIRSQYRLEREAYWRSLQQPFQAVLDALPAWRERFVEVAVATTKDSESTRALLDQAGLDIPVYGLEVGTDKSRHMQLLIDKYEVEPHSVYFIDDLLINLLDASKAGVRGHLALWGYNNEASRKKAQELGFVLLAEEDLPFLGTD